jgi:hypothetical protein
MVFLLARCWHCMLLHFNNVVHGNRNIAQRNTTGKRCVGKQAEWLVRPANLQGNMGTATTGFVMQTHGHGVCNAIAHPVPVGCPTFYRC